MHFKADGVGIDAVRYTNKYVRRTALVYTRYMERTRYVVFARERVVVRVLFTGRGHYEKACSAGRERLYGGTIKAFL